MLSQSQQQHNPAVAGALVALFFGTGSLTAATTGKVTARPAMLISTTMLLIGLALLVAAEPLRSIPMLIIATVTSGGATALGDRCNLQIVKEIAPPEQRAELVSSYLLVCYAVSSLPVIGVGLLTRGQPLVRAPGFCNPAGAAVPGRLRDRMEVFEHWAAAMKMQSRRRTFFPRRG